MPLDRMLTVGAHLYKGKNEEHPEGIHPHTHGSNQASLHGGLSTAGAIATFLFWGHSRRPFVRVE